MYYINAVKDSIATSPLKLAKLLKLRDINMSVMVDLNNTLQPCFIPFFSLPYISYVRLIMGLSLDYKKNNKKNDYLATNINKLCTLSLPDYQSTIASDNLHKHFEAIKIVLLKASILSSLYIKCQT